MQKTLFALSLGFAGVILAHQAAWSQTAANCGKRAKIVERLEVKYGETRQSMGLAQNNGVVEYPSGQPAFCVFQTHGINSSSRVIL